MRYRWWLSGTGLAVLLGWPFVTGTPYLLNLATGAAIWGIFAVSYDLIIGWTGEISFGHALYFGLGVYGMALSALYSHWPTVLLAVLVVVGSVLVALGLNWLTLRVTGPYFAMVTFALAEFAHLLVQQWSWTGGTNGLVGVPFAAWVRAPGILYVISAACALGAVLGIMAMRSRRWGLWIRAVRDNPMRAEMLGVSHRRVKVLTLTAAGGLAAVAGVLYVWYQGMAFTGVWDSNTSFTVLLMVIIGGLDTGWGPLVAGAGLYALETWLNSVTSHWEILLGLLYLAVVRILPKGLSGLALKWRTAGIASPLATTKSGGQRE